MSGLKPKLGGLKLKIPAMPGLPKPAGSSVQNPLKAGTSLTVKTPKTKKLPDATDKPSVFFKNEEIAAPKHASLQKLRDFLVRTRSKK